MMRDEVTHRGTCRRLAKRRLTGVRRMADSFELGAASAGVLGSVSLDLHKIKTRHCVTNGGSVRARRGAGERAGECQQKPE